MHPVNQATAAVSAVLKSVADVDPTFMQTCDKAAALRDLVVLETQVAELRLRVLSSADDVAADEGFRTSGTWLSHHARIRRSDAVADLKLAYALDRARPVLAQAVREGHVNIAQARVIAKTLEELPAHVGEDVIAEAEAKLVELAGDYDPHALSALGRRILEVVDPERFEAEEERLLLDAEKRAAERQRLSIRAIGDGTTRISGLIPDAVAARLTTYLHAFTNPRLADGAARSSADEADAAEASAFGSPLGHPRRLAEAFEQLLEVMDPQRLPIHGGDATHLMVTISLESLKTGLGVALIDNGVPGDSFDAITAHEARRLACNATIIPAVLGTSSEVLDLGRGARLFAKGQRRAAMLRDKNCRAEGCSIPGTWCEMHHLQAWQHGGKTEFSNSALLCSHHHHRVHDPAYDMSRLTNGDLRFHRRR